MFSETDNKFLKAVHTSQCDLANSFNEKLNKMQDIKVIDAPENFS